MQPSVASNSIYLSPLKPRKKNRALSKHLKHSSTALSFKDAENTSSGQDGRTQGTDADTLYGTDADTLHGTDTDTLKGESSETRNSSKKLEAFQRGILVLRRWHK
jgi:hypothetical protein